MDTWFIGNVFLQEIMRTFIAMRDSARREKRLPPYLFEHYNIKGFYPGGSVPNGLNCITTALVEALNNNSRLPKMLVIVPNKDIITNIKSKNFGATKIIGAAIHYIV